MSDLRKAAEMALEVFEHLSKGESPAITRGELVYEIAELRQALEESANSTADFVEPKVLAEPEQEPVCFIRETAWSYEIAPWDDPKGFPVYTAPPKREWVGLTDEERADCWSSSAVQSAINIEAKLKEKNT